MRRLLPPCTPRFLRVAVPRRWLGKLEGDGSVERDDNAEEKEPERGPAKPKEKRTVSYEEFRQAVAETAEAGKAKVFEPEMQADLMRKRIEQLRSRLLADESVNQLRLRFSDDDFVPRGTPSDHYLTQENSCWVTHMVPVDHVRPLVPNKFTLESVIHEKQEWALVTLRVQSVGIKPYRAVFGEKARMHTLTYSTYAVDRTTSERSLWTFSHYSQPSWAVSWMRLRHSFPVHPLNAVEADIEYDDAAKRFARYNVHTTGSRKAKAGAVNLRVEDTGVNARDVEKFAGFADPESAIVFICHNQVEHYQRRDVLVGRRDTWSPCLEDVAPVTVGRLLENSGYEGIAFTGEDGAPLRDAPRDKYPWIQFWDLLRLNRSRRLHSVLLHRGPIETTQYMPLYTDTERVHELWTLRSRARMMFRWLFHTPNPNEVMSMYKKPKLSEEEYEARWREGRFT